MNIHMQGLLCTSGIQCICTRMKAYTPTCLSGSHLKCSHKRFVSGKVSGENELLHERDDLLSLLGWQVVKEASLPQYCLSCQAVMLFQDAGTLYIRE